METGDTVDIELPKGCTAEKTHYGPDTVAIFLCRHGGKTGIVSIDFEQRDFEGGCCSVHRGKRSYDYYGRGWRDRLVADAIAWLKSVL